MALDPRTPVLVGVGQVTERPDPAVPITERPEPVGLMAMALLEAGGDSGTADEGRGLLARAQSLRVILPLSWPYVNPGVLVSERLGIAPQELALTAVGGNNPQTVVNTTARQIATGELDVALVTGAECGFTRLAARRDPGRPALGWTTQPDDTTHPVILGSDRVAVTDAEVERGLDRPLRVFPLFENALRSAAGRTIGEHQLHLSELWARFSSVAEANPYAWSPQPRSAQEIRTTGPSNRMVAFPYPKLMNANNRVDQGAAFILCSVRAAREAAVPEDRWVFPVAGADAHDHWFVSQRQDLRSSPAIRLAGERALGLAGIGIDDVAHVDLYSCFPCAVQIAALELGLALDDPGRSLTVTGGLGFAGGPGNNYVSHSIASMARRLRADPGAHGLVTGLGWYSTKHAVGVWSTTPPAAGFRHESPQEAVDALPQRTPAWDFEGDATVETYTVVHDRDGEPELGILALLTADGRRTWGNTADRDDMLGLMEQEGCGRKARLLPGGRIELR
ncbi:MAG TPA: acetyl-CoA acetyltransferase [Acidimicrobiales bacterium]